MLLAKTDPNAVPAHAGMTGFIVEKEPETSPPGLTIPMPGLPAHAADCSEVEEAIITDAEKYSDTVDDLIARYSAIKPEPGQTARLAAVEAAVG